MSNKFKRMHYCGEVTEKSIGEEVSLSGFVQKIRNLGSLLFIDLRDRTGIIQLAFDETTIETVFIKAQEVKPEYVIKVKGELKRRLGEFNKALKTGSLEVFVTEFEIVSKAATPPFEIAIENKVSEELRLKYRYLDLRRKEMQEAIIGRHKITKATRDYFNMNGFLEIETPTLIKSTPEGARDFLVPSRVNKGEFFALPQSPQIYKQLLMISGFDRYMQIARCYRDEDLRADRQPEFTQIDVEMSFVDEEDIIKINEGYIKYLFKEVLGKDIEENFARLTYEEAMESYGNDKPDIRYKMKIKNLSDILKDTGFNVFKSAISNGGSVRAIVAKGLNEKLTRKEIDRLTDHIKTFNGKGLAYSKLSLEGPSSSYEKFLTDEEKQKIYSRLNVEDGDVILIVADENDDVVLTCLSELRIKIAHKFELYDKSEFSFLWVTDFPMFEYSEDEKRYYAKHHPFTSPKIEDIDELNKNPLNVKARAYDLVLNGTEIGGGSIRITDKTVQGKVFGVLGLTDEEIKTKFGFLIDAYNYGAPNHGGIAYGLDRLVMLMLSRTSIRDVIAFPKTQTASELMTSCPSEVDEMQLKELGLAIKIDKK